MKIHTLYHDGRRYQFWYDRSIRMWAAAHVRLDHGDDLVDLGECIYEFTKREIIRSIKHGFVKD